MMKDNLFSDAKIVWLRQFFVHDGIWDAYGEESKFMFSKIKDLSMNTYRKTYTAANCQNPFKIVITTMWDADKDIQMNIND